ncbi:MAG: thiamine pyrophosphate-dependent enzyme [Myxococcota bacterium]
MARQMKMWAGLTAAELRQAYEIALETRASIIASMTMKTRGEGVEFWIGGPGEEVHGTATAAAFHKVLREEREPAAEVGFFSHYRSDALAAMTADLRGRTDFMEAYFRQALGRVTDPHSGGRQMVMHICMPEIGLMPVQSPVGMQLGKAAGWARGLQLEAREGVAVAVVGDGTTAESDMHEAMTAASLWKLPLIILVTDNEVAITVRPEDGRGIKSFERYAEAFDLQYFSCDGYDFLDTYEVTRRCAQAVLDEGRAAILHARVPRLMGHSSSSGGQFDYDERDPLLDFGEWLVSNDILPGTAVFKRGEVDKKKSYFEVHELGSLMQQKLDRVKDVLQRVKKEPMPSLEAGDLWRHAHPPHPDVEEPEHADRRTRVQINEAVNLALDRILSTGKAAMWGQDVGHRGGIFQCSAGLRDKYPGQVRDAPINEPMIVGTAMGASIHQDLVLLPEIQFGDYSLNCLHWFVHLGNLYWTTNGQVAPNVVVRFPVDPVQGGAVYHSMSCDGFYGNVPGLVITTPSTAWDAYGLLRTAAEYRGPVIHMEPKRLYRMKLGPALPGEPTDPRVLREAKRSGEPLPVDDYRVPFGKAALRRRGRDITVVSWGWAAWMAVSAANRLSEERGVEAEVWDLRTLVPYDREALFESARRTGRVLIAQSDRTFAGFGRQIQGDLVESLAGVKVRLIGQLNTPAVGQARSLEDAITLQEEDIHAALDAMADERPEAWLEDDLFWLRHAPSRQLV